jgi:hypothetical protein
MRSGLGLPTAFLIESVTKVVKNILYMISYI